MSVRAMLEMTMTVTMTMRMTPTTTVVTVPTSRNTNQRNAAQPNQAINESIPPTRQKIPRMHQLPQIPALRAHQKAQPALDPASRVPIPYIIPAAAPPHRTSTATKTTNTANTTTTLPTAPVHRDAIHAHPFRLEAPADFDVERVRFREIEGEEGECCGWGWREAGREVGGAGGGGLEGC